jgi:hypothetical protein
MCFMLNYGLSITNLLYGQGTYFPDKCIFIVYTQGYLLKDYLGLTKQPMASERHKMQFNREFEPQAINYELVLLV